MYPTECMDFGDKSGFYWWYSENALYFVDSGSGEIDSGTEQYISYIEVIHSVSHITITINIESSSIN